LATVITNLLSAIPWIGQSLVESINITDFSTIETVILPTIGTVSPHALKKGNKIRLNKQEYLSIPPAFIAFFVGLIDGDGYIQITKSTKGFVTIKLVISLHLEDISTLEYIQSVLKLGKLTVYKDLKSPSAKLIINRTDLQEVIFPLMLHYTIFFLTDTRKTQFDLAMYIFQKNIKNYANLLEVGNIPSAFEFPTKPEEYLALKYFKNWIIGFTMSEGSFCIKKNNDGCFQLKQRIHVMLFEALKLVFETNRKITVENNAYNQFSVSSRSDIQKVINFFSFSGYHPLIGKKSIQYYQWLIRLRNSPRYANLKYPEEF